MNASQIRKLILPAEQEVCFPNMDDFLKQKVVTPTIRIDLFFTCVALAWLSAPSRINPSIIYHVFHFRNPVSEMNVILCDEFKRN